MHVQTIKYNIVYCICICANNIKNKTVFVYTVSYMCMNVHKMKYMCVHRIKYYTVCVARAQHARVLRNF